MCTNQVIRQFINELVLTYPASPNDLLPVPVFGDAAFAAESEINNYHSSFTSQWTSDNIVNTTKFKIIYCHQQNLKPMELKIEI